MLTRDPSRPIAWVREPDALSHAVNELLKEDAVGLDIETTLRDRRLCLVQIAGSRTTYLIDALSVADLQPLGRLLEDPQTAKIIHNASFERGVLAQHGLAIEPVIDTLERSRGLRGREAAGGHSLAAVCERELGRSVDKSPQTSDWAQRPLTDAQVTYAALDAEVLRSVRAAFDELEDRG